MLVQRGGAVMGHVALKVSPDSELARRESLLPITDIGFENMAQSLLGRLEEEMRLDPKGENTLVQYYQGAKLNDRICTHVLAFEGDSQARWFEGNFTEYEAYRRKELGADADQPHRIKYKPLAR